MLTSIRSCVATLPKNLFLKRCHKCEDKTKVHYASFTFSRLKYINVIDMDAKVFSLRLQIKCLKIIFENIPLLLIEKPSQAAHTFISKVVSCLIYKSANNVPRILMALKQSQYKQTITILAIFFCDFEIALSLISSAGATQWTRMDKLINFNGTKCASSREFYFSKICLISIIKVAFSW